MVADGDGRIQALYTGVNTVIGSEPIESSQYHGSMAKQQLESA